MKKILLLKIWLLLLTIGVAAQKKQYEPVVISFYNCENFYDTINDPHTNDEDFTPDGKKKYTGIIYSNINTAELCDDICHQPFNVRAFAHVCDTRHRCWTK